MSVPFDERGGPVRGLLDVASGRWPRFVFGGGIPAGLLPVFHFHDVTPGDLEPKLRYLAENGYRTIDADQMSAYVRRDLRLDGPHVALCFDDAWASLWTVAAPLLRRYGLTAITYAIPARIEDAGACRSTIAEGASNSSGGAAFVTWPELKALHDSGVVDVQCHTESHSMVFCSTTVTGFVTPEYVDRPMLNWPQLAAGPSFQFLDAADLGAPLYTARSRMSDARRVTTPAAERARMVDYVTSEGGAAFFSRLDWEDRLRATMDPPAKLPIESEDERDRAIEVELDRGRSILNDRLRTNRVNHICLPWGVSSSQAAAALVRLGYRSAVANRLPGMLAVRPGDDPYWLKRLPNRYIFHLPGRGRRLWV